MELISPLRPKNWASFQHYKDRRPPWIRLYHSLLDNKDFWNLKGDDAKFLMAIWLIASENEQGFLPKPSELGWRLRLTLKKTERLLLRLQQWFEKSASTPLAECKQEDLPEERREETEIQRREEQKKQKRAPAALSLPEWVPLASWTGYVEMRKRKRAAMTDRAKELVLRQLDKWRSEGQDVGAILDRSTEHSWTGLWPIDDRNGSKSQPRTIYADEKRNA